MARAASTLPLRALLACACAALSVVARIDMALSMEPQPIKVAVYAFELEDFSAGGGIIAPDERDAAYLEQATQEARRLLGESGRYSIVDTSGAPDEPVKAHKMRACGGCVGPITRKLGADQAVIGTLTRINRTEYTLLVQFFDAGTGAPVANYFTGLRMGANYAWWRGVRSLMQNRILARPRT
ncbi:MAG: DUF3280 domain-containing protein [Hyphomicrobium sp.]|uniref:DUF3280 domain-containing protein n=1 Tax=Hyphomicrobium sp. TaxID=82 RepID=UPI00132A868D|nr:DUF3280 domain-containing protein [Hyphomicrobium sp.]KAB2940030.1 MAG: DUF3280 domain-containing protein [Hyphomicrobium sp.]MBZ0209545.1 DUF3280 domain-containing protein [Hyphomicrobium sp.]